MTAKKVVKNPAKPEPQVMFLEMRNRYVWVDTEFNVLRAIDKHTLDRRIQKAAEEERQK